MTCTHHRVTRECFTCNPPDRDELMAAIKEAQAIEDRCRLEATALAPLDILCGNDAMSNTGEACQSPLHDGVMREFGRCLKCGDVRYPDADERELAAEAAKDCGCRPTDLWVLSDTGEEVCLCDPRHPWPGHLERTIGSAPARAVLGRQLAVVTTPFPQTEAFEELVRGLGDGSIWARDALMRAYEAGKAERRG